MERYALGTLQNFRQTAEVAFAEETVLPTSSLPSPKPYTAAVEVKLRTAPKVLDRYDPERSEAFGHAVLGNILRIYLPGATAHVLAAQPAKPDGQWLFLLMERSSDRLITHDPSGARAGWVLSK